MIAKLSSAKKFSKILIILFIFRVILAFIVWHPDLNNHIDWGIRFFEYGPSKFFAPESNVWSFTWPNQPPGSIYLYAGIKVLFDFIFGIFWWINVHIPAFPSIIVTYFESNLHPALLQIPSILADFGIAYFIYKFIIKLKNNKNLAKAGALLWLINPVVWYNSAVWGQTDAVINFFALASIYYLLNSKKYYLSVFLFALSLYIKMSLVIFAPIYLIIFLRKFDLKKLFQASIPVLIIFLVATYPFSQASGMNPANWLIWLYQKKIYGQQLEIITANAFNLWAGIAGINQRPQTEPLLGLTYQAWGYILFALFYLPLLKIAWKTKKQINYIWVFALAGFSSWMLLTNMHERYLYPLFPYFTILVVLKPALTKLYWLISGISLLNLYNFWETPYIAPVHWLLTFGERVMARVFGFINFGLFIVLYKKYLKKVFN